MKFDPISFLEILKTNGVIISPFKGDIKVSVPKAASIPPQLLKGIKDNKDELLAFLNTDLNQLESFNETSNTINPCMRSEESTVSFSQERLYFLQYLHGSNEAYHMPVVLKVNGEFDNALLEESLRELVLRHKTLRTTFVINGDDVVQKTIDSDDWHLGHSRKCEFAISESKKKDYIKRLLVQPFDLALDFMFRAELIEVSNTEHYLVLVAHHIASDGWSLSILIEELVDIYNAKKNQTITRFAKCNITYTDYAAWQRKTYDNKYLERSKDYWTQYLSDVEPLSLPTDHSKPTIFSKKGERLIFNINEELNRKLRIFSQEEGVTLFMVMLSAFQLFLHKYTNQNDITIGTVFANRNRREVERLVGFFANTVVLRNNINIKDSYKDYLQEVKEVTLEASRNQGFPFEKLVEIINPDRNIGYNPLFQIAFLMQEIPKKTSFKLGHSTAFIEDVHNETSKFDLTFEIISTGDGLRIRVEYLKDLFDKSTIKNMVECYRVVLNSLVDNPNQKIEDISLLNSKGLRKIEALLGNRGNLLKTNETSILDFFERKVEDVPNHIAIDYEGDMLTYRELNVRANQLAHYLKQDGVGTGDLVPVLLERSIDMVIALLAILKAGGAYVPIDPQYPKERISYILNDVNPLNIITHSKYSKELISDKSLKVISIDVDKYLFDNQQISNQDVYVTGSNAMYVIYTSGSTGRPKGVVNEHSGALNRLLWALEHFDLSNDDVFLQKTTFCFDVSVWEIFCPLLLGAKLVLAKVNEQANTKYLKSIIEKKRITILHFVPSMLDVFLLDNSTSDCKSLKNVICSGEVLTAKSANYFSNKYPSVRLHNLYGPTEASIDVTCWEVPRNTVLSSITIGRPIPGVQLYILDDNKRIVPTGMQGELYIEGVQLARGYLNRPELTTNTFIKVNVNGKSLSLYATGDMVALRPDGNIKYIGRIDKQVKVRGYRIELGEIEETILQSQYAKQAAVVVRGGDTGYNQLVCFVVLEETKNKDELRKYLSERLPSYMLPGIIVEIEELPLTLNGKVDTTALLNFEIIDKGNVEIPKVYDDKLVRAITDTWEEVLGIKGISVNSNFFELGGDSIMTIRIVNKLKQLGYDVDPQDIFTSQSVLSLASLINKRTKKNNLNPNTALVGESELLPIQQWFFENQSKETISYFNQSVLLKVRKDISIEILNVAVKELVSYHDSLRFSYIYKESKWIQKYNPLTTIELTIDDISIAQDEEQLKKSLSQLGNKYHQGLSIEKGEVVKPILFNTHDVFTHNRFLLIIHHLVVDAVSWHILLEDLELILDKLMKQEKIVLIPKTGSYRDWYNALDMYSNSNTLNDQKEFWYETVKKGVQHKYDYSQNEKVRVADINNYQVSLSKDKTRQLLYGVSKAYKTEINDILLAALAMTLCSWTNKDDIVIGVESYGRRLFFGEVDVSHTTGWFTALYPLLLHKPVKDNSSGWVRGIKEQIRKVPDNGLGYGVLKYIRKDSVLSGNDPWDIMFNYLGQIDTIIGNSKYLEKSDEPTGSNVGEKIVVTKLLLDCIVNDGELSFKWSYSKLHYLPENIEKLSKLLASNLLQLIDHCILESEKGTKKTPSDFGLEADVSWSELDDFFDDDEDNDTIMKF